MNHSLLANKKLLRGCSTTKKLPLYDDLVLLILDQLPYKSLCKFKSASTHWYELISLAQLNRKKLIQVPRKPCLLIIGEEPVRISHLEIFEDRDQPVKLTPCLNHLSTISKHSALFALPCVGELVCLTVANSFYICNPRTEQIVALPDPSPSTLLCLPTRCAAFGYLPLTNEYKLATIFTSEAEVGVMRCEIFTISEDREVESCSWRVVEEVCPLPVKSNRKGVMVKGIFYWLTFEEISRNIERRPHVIFLDVFTKKFGLKAIPTEVFEETHYSNNMEQVELEGQYCLVDAITEIERMVIWSLKNEYGDDSEDLVWEKKYNIYIPNINAADFLHCFSPLYVWDGEMVLYHHWYMPCTGICFYNLQSGKFRLISNELFRDMPLLATYINGPFPLRSASGHGWGVSQFER